MQANKKYLDLPDSIYFKEYPKDKIMMQIGNNVFIGANTTLLYDVSIGNNVIIGAGSVVTKDIPDGVVAAGVPCKVIGTYDDFKERMKDNK